MGRLEKIKRDHIKEVNKLVDEGFKKPDVSERPIILKPSSNITKSSQAFIDKMNNLL